ncbi:MAG: alcohol dehydrogenase catalytic domain-containing protein, partial [Gemmatimonadota bacterium]
MIRAFNEERHLPALLAALDEQEYREFEVIVVDSGSWDRTREIAVKRCDKLLRIEPRDFTFGYSLNVGVRAARGRYIAIVSAHTRPLDRRWLGALIEPFRDGDTAMVYGRQLGAAVSKFSECQDFRRTFGDKRLILRPPRFLANNANSAVRRDLWEQHAFDESLPGLEDIEWAKYWMERGHKVVYEPAAPLCHIHEETWRQVRRRYYREAVAARWMGLKDSWHLMLELGREAGYLAADLSRAATEAVVVPRRFWDFGRLAHEIALFRYNKAAGTARGLFDGSVMSDPAERQWMYYDRSFKAVVIHAPSRAGLEELELPEIKPGDVLIEVAYVGVCPMDLKIFDGSLGYYRSGRAKYPIVPGHEFSGRVVSAGANVKDLREGNPVVVECIQSCGCCPECLRSNWIGCSERVELGVIGRNGAYAEYVVVPGQFVHRVPDDLDLRRAALCEPLAVVLKGLRRLGVVPNRAAVACAVVGAGPLGHLCARVLERWGEQVTIFDRNPIPLGYFQNSGIAVSNSLAGISGFDVVVEATGDPEVLQTILSESRAQARVLLLGLPYGQKEVDFEEIV